MRYIVHPSLVHIKHSPWWKLFYSGDECALITVTGFNHWMFYILHAWFKIMYGCFTMFGKHDYSVQEVKNGRGQKRAMTSEDCLGLVLLWMRTRGSLWSMSLIFGVILSVLKRYLQFGKVVLLESLNTNSNIQVKLLEKKEEVL
eukprot:5780105-Ditylum_brightwellii.AAC.1